MELHAPGSAGLLGSVRAFADGVLGSVHERIELLAVELHEEKHRLVQIFIWISSIVFLAMLATVFASLAVVVLYWDTARVQVVCLLAAAYAVALVAVVFGFRRYLKRQPRPFSATLNELKQDRECIRPEN
jgi:uncharacterized membrane protein YqjE